LGPFVLPNPGGGAELLEDASMVLVPGRRYALIGRNGKGKSTLLKAAAARRVGALPDSLSVYYVNQEVALAPELEAATPVDVVLEVRPSLAPLPFSSLPLATLLLFLAYPQTDYG
jgi:ATP-binding cassette subfamily F protein 3